MSLPLDPCKQQLSELILSLLAKFPESSQLNLSASDIFSMMEKPPESHMGDFSLPCFRFAKVLKLPPPKIAASLAEELIKAGSPWVAKAAPLNAFLNIYVNPDQMTASTLPLAIEGTLFTDPIAAKKSQGRVMVEYSQPNTHKEFHVGHLRNVSLGSSLVNLYRYCGFDVIAVNYFGDEGAHIAKCLWMMRRLGTQPQPDEDRGAWLGKIYVEAVKALEEANAETRAKYDLEVSAVLRGIESKQGEWFELWRETKEWSLKAFRSVYDWVGVHFDREFFESEVSEDSQSIVDEYLAKGVFKLDQGAVGADLNDYKLGFMLVRKRDGNTLYATKDLVLARRKFNEFKIDRNIYVVANEQDHHFRQVFKTLELMGFQNASLCQHLSYGMVVLPEGKMSSRDGTSIPFLHLKNKMLQEINTILEKYRGDWSDAEINETAKRLCVGALMYGMLQADPAREIVFNMKDWLSFEGNTGPYLMYGYSRAQSVLKKAKEHGHEPLTSNDLKSKPTVSLSEQSEQELLRSIYDFNTVVKESCLGNRPNHLCHHLYAMCKNFSRFYAEVPILKSENKDLIRLRLALVESYRNTLKTGLALLGVQPPDRM